MSLKIALAGNPNCGKTTLFNALTGSNQYVGNWPGVTVEKKEGRLKNHKDVVIMDLPGIYSLSPYTLEEVVARNYLIGERPDAIINIVDGTNIERNLYLTTQIIELGFPVVIAINMMDLVVRRGDKIDIKELGSKLGCEVVEISALKGTGVTKAAERAVAAAKAKKAVVRKHNFDPDVEAAIASVEGKLGVTVEESQKRFFAIKLLERDSKIAEQMKTLPDVEEEIQKLEEEFDDDTESIITNERYAYISSIIGDCVKKAAEPGSLSISDKIDRVVTNRILAIPIFVVVMFLVYYISMVTVGSWATDWVNDNLFDAGFTVFGHFVPSIPMIIESGLNAIGCAAWLQGLILDGIVAGIGAVLGFVPQMLVLFILLAILEYCGYMARIAFILDRVFRKFGLSGKSFIPMLISSGCGVPGIMSSRTIESEKDRRMTIMTTTFIPCSAKIPFIAMVAGALLGGSPFVATGAYFIGVIAVICSGIMLKKTKMFAGEPTPFVMELPAYHLPKVGSVLRSMWERAWSFMKKAGTIILLSTIVIWFVTYFGVVGGQFRMLAEEEIDHSILAAIGGAISWIFIPQGWGNWQATVASISGLVAKENIVGTMGILYSGGGSGWAGMTAAFMRNGSAVASGLSFLMFNLLCAPCFAAMGAIKREMNSRKWFWFAIGYQCGLAYLVSLVVFRIAGLFTGECAFGLWTVVAVLIIALFIYMLFRKNRADEPELVRGRGFGRMRKSAV